MKAKILGVQKVGFTNNNGEVISGTNIFVAFPDENVEGVRTEKFWLKDGINLPRDTAYDIKPYVECTAKKLDMTEFLIQREESVQDPVVMVGETFVVVMSYNKDEKEFFRMTPTIKFEDASSRKYKQTFEIDISDRLGNGIIINYAQPELCEE